MTSLCATPTTQSFLRITPSILLSVCAFVACVYVRTHACIQRCVWLSLFFNILFFVGEFWCCCQINVCEAMGANIVNTVAEGVAPLLEQLTGARVGLKILTNLCVKRLTTVTFKIPVDALKWKGVEGRYASKLTCGMWW